MNKLEHLEDVVGLFQLKRVVRFGVIHKLYSTISHRGAINFQNHGEVVRSKQIQIRFGADNQQYFLAVFSRTGHELSFISGRRHCRTICSCDVSGYRRGVIQVPDRRVHSYLQGAQVFSEERRTGCQNFWYLKPHAGETTFFRINRFGSNDVLNLVHGLPTVDSVLNPKFFTRATLVSHLLRHTLDIHQVNPIE